MRRPPLEIQIGRLFGWPLVVVTVLSGLGSGLVAIAISDATLIARRPEWLVIPACIPFCFALAFGRSLLMGALGGIFAATIAFLTMALYAVWMVACFVITFMGDC